MRDDNRKKLRHYITPRNAARLGIVLICAIVIAFSFIWVINRFFYQENPSPEGTPPLVEVGTATPDPDAMPAAEQLEMSRQLAALKPNSAEWTQAGADGKSEGIYCISRENLRYLVYQIDSENVCEPGRTLQEYNHIWVNSEDDNFYAVINLSGKIVDLSDFYILVRDDTRNYAGRLIINCYEATEVRLGNAILTGTLLAPKANVILDHTDVFGQILSASAQGTKLDVRKVVFTGYDKVLTEANYADIKNDAVRIAAVEFLKQKKPELYSYFTTASLVPQMECEEITELRMVRGELNDPEALAADLSQFPNLVSLNMDGTSVEKLDLSEFVLLQKFSANSTKLTSVVLTGLTSLYSFQADDTPLKELDLTGLSGLLEVSVNQTSLTELDLTQCPNLVNLGYAGTKISVADFRILPQLVYLNCSGTGVKDLNGEELPRLRYLIARNNKGIRLNPDSFPVLQQLDISNCSLTSLDLTGCQSLSYLKCSSNNLSRLDVSGLTALRSLEIYDKSLKRLDITGTSQWLTLYCYNGVLVVKGNTEYVFGGEEEEPDPTPTETPNVTPENTPNLETPEPSAETAVPDLPVSETPEPES